MREILKVLIKTYSYLISPLTGPKCRFHPTCSAYAADAIDRHGAAKGTILAAKRICKCHPWHKGAYLNPVPSVIDWDQIIGYKRGEQLYEKKDHDHAK